MRIKRRGGFTLIELLIVCVIIGVLAAIAIPKFANTKDKAYLATLKSSLRNLATAQEAYLYDNSTYYDGAIPSASFDYRLTTGVTVTIQDVSASGWAATATHSASLMTCALYVGAAPAPTPATEEGETACS